MLAGRAKVGNYHAANPTLIYTPKRLTWRLAERSQLDGESSDFIRKREV